MATWHVRPDAGHGGTNAGASYANAWQGWSSITWGAGGVTDGDTLEVHGAHAYSSTISVGAHGAAAESERVTITGVSSVGDNGSITFTGASFLQNTRAYTTITNLTIVGGTSNCIFTSGGATNCIYSNNTLTSNGASAFSLNSSTGANHSNITISGNTFLGASSTTGSGAALSWFVTATSALSTLTNVTVSNNTFRFDAGRAVIHFRTEDDTDAGSVMTGIVISGNRFESCTGLLVDIEHGHDTVGIGGTLQCFDNVALGCGESLGSAGTGGMFFLNGFANADIYNNQANGLDGSVGFCNVFYGTYRIYGNKAENLTTTTIDGNGVLFDHESSGKAWGNEFRNMAGKVGAANSGVGIMVLDATNVTCSGNLVVGCKWGVHLGAQLGGQSCKIVNNTIANCADGAIYTSATADLANCEIKQNIFIGNGYSVYDQTAVSWSSEDYNYFYGFSSGTSNHSLGANSSTADPLLDANYRPRSGSPCIGAGTRIDGLKDFYGKEIVDTPDIGAIQLYAARTVGTARSIGTRSIVSTDRNIPLRRAVI